MLVDAYGRVLAYASEEGGMLDYCYHLSNGIITPVAYAEVQAAMQWGTTEITVTTEGSVSSFTLDGTEYSIEEGLITPTINDWVPILYTNYDETSQKHYACGSDGVCISWLPTTGPRNFLVYRGSGSSYQTISDWEFSSLVSIASYRDVEVDNSSNTLTFEFNGKTIEVDMMENTLNTSPVQLT